MTHKPDSIHCPGKSSSPRLLLHGLAWFSGLSFLSGGMVFAQSAPADPGSVPSAQDLLMPVEPAPAAPSVAAPAPVAPETPVPVVIEQASPSPVASPESRPTPAAEVAPETPIALPSRVVDEIQTLTPGGDRYIDNTDYNLGATPSYGQKPDVVLSERSTGCQVTLLQGQSLPASVCANSPQAPGQSGQMASVGSINVGPVHLSSNGIGIGRNYYNLTQRPMGMLGNGNSRLLFPLSLPSSITSAFGWRIHPITGVMRFHYGTDLGAPMGTPVLAAYSGRVAIADFMSGYGLTVVMRHSSPDAQTLYAHLSEIFVQPGETVTQGQVIGRVGSTGNSTGPHLHFEYRERTDQGWVALNPGGLLETALAQFGSYFQVAQAPSPETKFVPFHLNGVDGLLKALKENPELVASTKAQSFGDFPVVFDPNVVDLILSTLDLVESGSTNLAELNKGWSKTVAATEATTGETTEVTAETTAETPQNKP